MIKLFISHKIKLSIMLFGIILIAAACNYDSFFLPIYNLDNTNMTDSEKNAFFNARFVSKRDIVEAVDDATAIADGAPFAAVYYFDQKNHFWEWTYNYISRGSWNIESKILPLTYNGRWRFALVQQVCFQYEYNYAVYHDDTCDFLMNIVNMRNISKIKKGDIFEMQRREAPPFKIMQPRIDFKQLEEMVSLQK